MDKEPTAALRAMRQKMEYGEIRTIARANRMDEKRASDLLRGAIKPKARDMRFLIDCYNVAMPRKTALEPFNNFLK